MPLPSEIQLLPQSQLTSRIFQAIFSSNMEAYEYEFLAREDCPSLDDIASTIDIDAADSISAKTRMLCCMIHHQKFIDEAHPFLMIRAYLQLSMPLQQLFYLFIFTRKYFHLSQILSLVEHRPLVISALKQDDYALLHFALTHTGRTDPTFLYHLIALFNQNEKSELFQASFKNQRFIDRLVKHHHEYHPTQENLNSFKSIIQQPLQDSLPRAQHTRFHQHLIPPVDVELFKMLIESLIRHDLIEYVRHFLTVRGNLIHLMHSISCNLIVQTAVDAHAQQCLLYFITRTEAYQILESEHPNLLVPLIHQYAQTLPDPEELVAIAAQFNARINLHVNMFRFMAVNVRIADPQMRQESMRRLFNWNHSELIKRISDLLSQDGPSSIDLQFKNYIENTHLDDPESEEFKLPILYLKLHEQFLKSWDDFQHHDSVHFELGLDRLAANPESAMHVDQELSQDLKQLEEIYRDKLQTLGGIPQVHQHILRQAEQLYQKNPAVYTSLRYGKITLPLTYQEFALHTQNWDPEETHKANQEYFKHPIHSGYRYFIDHNPWSRSKPNNRANHLRDVMRSLSILWIAANDETVYAVGDYTLESRIENFYIECGLMLRAHNWDVFREIIDVRGKPVKQQYDDLSFDNPSCLQGMKSRLLQTLQGYPKLNDIEGVIDEFLRDYVRNHFSIKIKAAETRLLEEVLVSYYQFIDNPEQCDQFYKLTQDWEPVYIDLKCKLQKAVLTIPMIHKTQIKQLIQSKVKELKNHNLPQRNYFWKINGNLSLLDIIHQTLRTRADHYRTENFLQLSEEEQFKQSDDVPIQHFEKALYLSCFPRISVAELIDKLNRYAKFRDAFILRYSDSILELQTHFQYTDDEMVTLCTSTEHTPLFARPFTKEASPQAHTESRTLPLNLQIVNYFLPILNQCKLTRDQYAEMFEVLIAELRQAPSSRWAQYRLIKWILDARYQLKPLQFMEEFLQHFPHILNQRFLVLEPNTTPTAHDDQEASPLLAPR